MRKIDKSRKVEPLATAGGSETREAQNKTITCSKKKNLRRGKQVLQESSRKNNSNVTRRPRHEDAYAYAYLSSSGAWSLCAQLQQQQSISPSLSLPLCLPTPADRARLSWRYLLGEFFHRACLIVRWLERRFFHRDCLIVCWLERRPLHRVIGFSGVQNQV